MKKYFLVILAALSFSALATGPQDIVIKSRLDEQSSASLINRVRTFLIHNQIGDPYQQEMSAPVIINLSVVLQELPEDTRSWIKELQSLLNLKVFESVYKMRVDNLSYSIQKFNSELRPIESIDNRIEYVTINSVQGLKISAKRIAFQVELNRTTSGEPIKFDIELIGPDFIVSPDLVAQLPMGWSMALLPSSLYLSLHSIDLSEVFKKVVENPQLVDLVVKDFNMPTVSIRVGNRELNFDKEKIKKFMLSKKDDMKLAIIDLLQTRMQDRFSNIIKDRPLEVFLKRTITAADTINAVFDLKSLNAFSNSRLIEAKVDGHFCSSANDIKDNYCRDNQISAKERRKVEVQTFNQSMQEIDNLIFQKKANVAVSVSEHYLNQLIAAAAEANLFVLGGDDFKLGPEKAFVLAEEKGPGFNLYLDIIYKLKRSERIMVGKSELRFPVRLSIGLNIVLVNTIPTLQIKVLGLKTDSNLLLKGASQYGLVSNVNTVRFQKKVLDRILEDIEPFNQKLLVEIDLKEFKGTYLEELNFFSDGKGRGTAILFLNGEKISR